MKQINIKNWLIVYYGNETIPCLYGETYNDPRYNNQTREFADGHHIVTSQIKECIGNKIVTKSGSCYILGNEGNFEIEKNHPVFISRQLRLANITLEELRNLTRV
jgi:hypothetical protein